MQLKKKHTTATKEYLHTCTDSLATAPTCYNHNCDTQLCSSRQLHSSEQWAKEVDYTNQTGSQNGSVSLKPFSNYQHCDKHKTKVR